MPEQRAFWDYDHYPFVLHGPVIGSKLNPVNQLVYQVSNYGGAWFKTFATLDEPNGGQLASALESLGESHARESRELRERYHGALQAILNVYKVEHPRAAVLFKKETQS